MTDKMWRNFAKQQLERIQELKASKVVVVNGLRDEQLNAIIDEEIEEIGDIVDVVQGFETTPTKESA